MTTPKIESLEQNTSTQIEVNSVNEALEWVAQLQNEIRNKLEASLCYEDIIAEHEATIKGFIKMWTPPVQYTIDVAQNNIKFSESNDSQHDEVMTQLTEIKRDLCNLRKENREYYSKYIHEITRVVSNWSHWVTTFLVFVIAGKKLDRAYKAAEDAMNKNNEQYEIFEYNVARSYTTPSDELNFSKNQPPVAQSLKPCFTLVIKDTREQIEKNIKTWLSDFIQLVQYKNLKSGVSLAFIRKYLYDTIDTSEASHTQNRINNLLTKYFEAELVDYDGEYKSADLFDFEYNPELNQPTTTKKALIYKGKLLFKGIVVFPQ